ncbi:MAG: sulfatase-like hydrolase/transferase, partial [Chloroflexota bacterium]
DLVKPENPPDVYYFLLDSYGRADGLYAAYKYDNSEFLSQLEQRGFFVAQCSQSNYVRTELSLASTLNMMYLQDLDDDFKADSTARRTLWNSLQHSAVRANFESLGYTSVTFDTGFEWLNISDADIFVEPPPFSSGMTEFEGVFLRTTFARYAQDWGWVDPDAVMGQSSRDRFNNIFDHVDDVAKMPEPTYTYMHVISPHPPFVFDAEGNSTYPPDFWNENRQYPPDLYAAGYQNQLTYLNDKMLEAIDTILAESETPPIIILQGDHGPWLQPKNKRMWILNAYYLPGHSDKLYPDISPVNTFRLVFNSYFGGDYDMLDDISYFSPVPLLYEFSEIRNDCK